MDPGQPDVLEQVPAGGGVNKPASGTYGEGAELDRLKAALPGGGDRTRPTSPTPPSMGMPSGPGAPGAPAGLPEVLGRPTTRPDVPINTPLAPMTPQNPVAGAVDAQQRRLALLDALSQSPEVSEETREWAGVVMKKIIEATSSV